MKYAYLVIALLIFQTTSGESFHELDLKPGEWSLKPALFYIASVVDERTDKNKTGQALVNNQLVPVRFKGTAESDLLNYINGSVEKDTSLVPLIFAIKKFELKETGTTSSHKASFDFAFVIYRQINDKRYQLYESKGNPVMTMRGPYINPHEKNIDESMKSVFTNFDQWLNENRNLPPMAKSAKLIFTEPRKYSGDTILWNAGNKLKWSDFKGTNINGGFMAQSNCMFDYRLEPIMKDGILELNMNLTACFERNSSWVKTGAEQEALLRHEQLHFDICELNIRKLKEKMMLISLNPMEFDQQLKILFDEGWRDYQLEQHRYDDETQHGILEKEQRSWEERVEKELKIEN